MADVLFLILRRLRAPLVTLIVVYAISVGGLTLMPGADPDGQAHRLSFFHAFYIMSYTATTIGFGEVPHPFSDAQRLWMTISIYLSVVGWAYAIGSVFALSSDPTFRAAVARNRFASQVRRLTEPFHIVCGYGQSGASLARALDRMGFRVVVVEQRNDRAGRILIEDFAKPPLVLSADARMPDVLEDAGVRSPLCLGMMAFTSEDSANQAIAIGARVLNKSLRVVSRAKSRAAQDNLEAFGGVHVINPFETFATNLALDLASPEVLRLEEWLTGAPGSECPSRVNVPHGQWVLVGFGRFGRAIAEVLDRAGVEWRAVDPGDIEAADARLLAGGNSQSALREAGVATADVLVAGTDSDAVNLGVTTLARRMNPGIFVVIRQNHVADRVLIEAANAQMRFVQADLMVHECLQILKTPMLGRFIAEARAQGGVFAARTIDRITEAVGTGAPRAWAFRCDVMQPGMFGAFFQRHEMPLRLAHLLCDPTEPSESLAAVALMVERKASTELLPPADLVLRPGDQILFVGDDHALALQRRFLDEPGTIDYVMTGSEPPRGWILRKLRERAESRRAG